MKQHERSFQHGALELLERHGGMLRSESLLDWRLILLFATLILALEPDGLVGAVTSYMA